MERTQIYLSKTQAAALDLEARRRGTTRSHLIREAIEQRYSTEREQEAINKVLEATAGLWKDRTETGAEYVDRVRTGRRLLKLYEDEDDAPS